MLSVWLYLNEIPLLPFILLHLGLQVFQYDDGDLKTSSADRFNYFNIIYNKFMIIDWSENVNVKC